MENEKVIGGWALSNHGGVSVLEMDEEKMLVRWYDDEPQECEIHWEEAEEGDGNGYLYPYIEINGHKLDLTECMRTDF